MLSKFHGALLTLGAPVVAMKNVPVEPCARAFVCVMGGRRSINQADMGWSVFWAVWKIARYIFLQRRKRGKSGHCTLRKTKESKEDQLSVWLCPKQHPIPHSALLLIGCHLECKLCYTLLYRPRPVQQNSRLRLTD